ncbi:hypothetical protein V8C43DRAFT_280705 [Trichoderma afarasin]
MDSSENQESPATQPPNDDGQIGQSLSTSSNSFVTTVQSSLQPWNHSQTLITGDTRPETYQAEALLWPEQEAAAFAQGHMNDWELHAQSNQQSYSGVPFSMDAQMGSSMIYNLSFQSHGDGAFDMGTSLFEDFTSTSSFPIVNNRTYQENLDNSFHSNVGLGQEQLNLSDPFPHIGDQNSTPYILQPDVPYGVEDNAYANSILYDQHNIHGSWGNDTNLLQHNFASEHEINFPDDYQSASSLSYQETNLSGQFSSIADSYRNICPDVAEIAHPVNHGPFLPRFENGPVCPSSVNTAIALSNVCVYDPATCTNQTPELPGSAMGESHLSANISNTKTQPSIKLGDTNTLQLKRKYSQVSTAVLPARKTILRRKLTAKESKQRAYVREQGVCIRCRLTGIQCSGDTPCTRCLLIENPRIWIKPCTKAEFLDIIIDSSYFPNQYIHHQYLRSPSQLGHTFVPIMDVKFQLRLMESSMTIHTGLIATKIPLSWKEIIIDLYSCSFENFAFRNRIDFSHMAKRVMRKYRCLKGSYLGPAWSKKVLQILISGYIRFETELDGPDLKFCHTLSKTAVRDTHSSLWWLFVRQKEMQFFLNLQRMCLNLYKLQREELEDFITIVMDFLIFAPPFPSIRFTAFNRDSEDFFPPVSTAAEKDFIDRNRRIRMALWVYVSIAVRRLESWSRLASGLHTKWPITCWKYFQQSFEAFESKSHNFQNRFGKLLLQMALSTLSLHDTKWTPFTDVKEIKFGNWRGAILAVDHNRNVYCILTGTQLNDLFVNIDQLAENGTLLDGGDEVEDEGGSSITFSFI